MNQVALFEGTPLALHVAARLLAFPALALAHPAEVALPDAGLPCGVKARP